MQKLFFLQKETKKKTNSSINDISCFAMLVQGKLTEQRIPKLVTLLGYRGKQQSGGNQS